MTGSIVGSDRNDQQHVVPFRQAHSKKKEGGQRRLVLSEEDYTDKLSKIIQRDFFPDVSSLERQNALLDCRLRGDAVGAVAVRRAARRLMENEAAIADQRERDDYDLVETKTTDDEKSLAVRRDNKHSIGGGTRLIRKRPRQLEEENVTGFHARATNEDDDEFDSNLKRDIQENRQRLEDVFQYNTNSKSNSSESSNYMASDDFAAESNRIGREEWNQPKIQNGLFFNPTPNNGGSSSSQQNNNNDNNDRNDSELLLDSNEVSISSSASNKRETSLMLPPSKEQTHLMLKSQLVEYISKHSMEKKIVPNATRFPSKLHPFMPMVTNKDNGILNDGTEMDSDTDADYMSSTDASTDLDAPLRGVEEERRRLKRKQRSDQQSYVVMTPQIIPGSDGNHQLPIITWGIAGIPTISSGGGLSKSESELESNVAPNYNSITSSSLSASPFQISSTSERERAAQKAETILIRRAKLATSSSSFSSKARKRKNKNVIGITTAKKGVGSLTPAALSLLEKTKSTQSRSRDAFGSSLRTSYTPRIHSSMSSSSSSIKHRRGGSQYSKRDHAYNSTPQK
ncbi:hypothetical protein FRACYDRAFT_236840 [Fragilariopsis cylindrus CCMP1102]|uniref:Nuclear protein Es2 n=1 Tax=Fragilariopsis cylindrus CCMP1102 TaxID=635003 RepID=A0A1E7FL89_9STRA|nr:hypothetical protein FRACYDRAFT_236840 [Fragilariopsis cylindrus CCMP1102]|eukprot:OEU18563.1 hypothetical protein FRACYDRAFT_236840 [Fragilariopsis cylindrus CCMP1102]